MNAERYEELICRWQDDNPMSDEDIEELFNMIYDQVEAGEKLSGVEFSILMDESEVDSEILDVGRKGWVEMRGIYKIRGRYWAIDYDYNDMCGIECEEQVLREVVQKPVVHQDWVFVDKEEK